MTIGNDRTCQVPEIGRSWNRMLWYNWIVFNCVAVLSRRRRAFVWRSASLGREPARYILKRTVPQSRSETPSCVGHVSETIVKSGPEHGRQGTWTTRAWSNSQSLLCRSSSPKRRRGGICTFDVCGSVAERIDGGALYPVSQCSYFGALCLVWKGRFLHVWETLAGAFTFRYLMPQATGI